MVSETLSHYRIIAEIGRGGMGVVYKALDLKLNREVALKVLRPELVTDGARKQRFVQEARAAAALTHPGIAVVYEIDEADGESFIAMELVRGKTLREVLEEGRLPLGRALRIARAVLSALATAHDKPIIHRDLKPENVMVLLGDDIKILDFGLAKLVEPGEADELMASRTTELRTREGTIMGTAAYMSPEQAEGKPVDVRSDVFSFGVVLYEILTGRRPFRGDSLASLQASILKDEPQFEENDASITTDLKKIVSRCLEKNKEVGVDLVFTIVSTTYRHTIAGM